MADGEFFGTKLGIIMDYNAPADTVKTDLILEFNPASVDTVQYQIIDVSGYGSRRKVALTANVRQIV